MSRNPKSPLEDRLLPSADGAGNLYRIYAVQAHSWSTVLLEDKFGRLLLAVPRTGQLTVVDGATVQHWIDERTYRVWNGDRAWAPLGQLPLLSGHSGIWQTPVEGSDAAL